MHRTLEHVTFRGADVHLRRGARAWRAGWPPGMWVEMCIDNECKYVIHRDGTYEKWQPSLHDYAESIWCVHTG